jgi:hypothetical protein
MADHHGLTIPTELQATLKADGRLFVDSLRAGLG